MSSWTGCTSTSDANAWNRCTNMSFETALVPRHRGFDGFGMAEDGQVFGGEEHLDAARHPRLAADQAEALQREHHLMHGGRTDPEMALHVGLGRGTAMDAGVGVNEGQVLTLRVGEPCRGHRHTIDSSAPLVTERHDDHTLSSRPERSRALRAPDPAPR